MAQPNEQRPNLVTVQRRALFCVICRGQLFFDRDIDNQNLLRREERWSLWLTCANCGYVHQFRGRGHSVELWLADRGYPAGALGDSDGLVDSADKGHHNEPTQRQRGA